MPCDKNFNFRQGWLIGWGFLVTLSLIALVNVSKDTCHAFVPILLSRALTTDPYRGICLVFCLFAAISSIYLNSILLSVGFFGFFSAFLVSMFETEASHDAFIFFSSLLVMYECRPKGTNIYWKVHWWSTVGFIVICAGWFMYIWFGCRAVDWDGIGPIPPSVYCARCSWWFVSEYLAFWSMFMLVWWKIDPTLKWHDKIYRRLPMDSDASSQDTTASKERFKDEVTVLNF